MTDVERYADPLAAFDAVFARAGEQAPFDHTAMTLATSDETGRPGARIVLLHGHDARGFVFFTNYESRKGRDIDANPQAALCFYWPWLDRAGAHRGTSDAPRRGRIGRLFRHATARQAGGRLGLGAKPAARLTRGARQRAAGRSKRATPAARFHARPSGAASASRPIASSSGKPASTGCTTASCSRERPTAGGGSVWPRRAGAEAQKRRAQKNRRASDRAIRKGEDAATSRVSILVTRHSSLVTNKYPARLRRPWRVPRSRAAAAPAGRSSRPATRNGL